MKKALMIALALLISIAFVTTVMAQPKPEAKPAAAPEKAPAPEKAVKAKAKVFKGEFVSMDAAAKTMVAKDAKGEMTFDVAGVKKMPELKAGDKIGVTYVEKDGKNVAKKVAVAKEKAKKPKKEAKPAEPKPAAPAPAPAK